MSDGWTRPTKLSIINFMVYSKGSTIFLKSVDASDKIKDNKYIYGLLKDVIKEVGEANVVQIVTDNGLAFMKAGKLLMKKYNLYWTPCAAHCINLMFEDIGRRANRFGINYQCTQNHQLHLQSWLVACENEKGLWWRYCVSGGNKICDKLHRPRKSSKKEDRFEEDLYY